MIRNSRAISVFLLTILLASGVALADNDGAISTLMSEKPSTASGVLMGATDTGAAFQVIDARVTMVQVKIFDPATDAVLFDSGKVPGQVVRWNTDLVGSSRFRVSVQGWNAAEELLIHHIKSTTGDDIFAVNFDTIPADLKLLAGPPITMGADVDVFGTLDVASDGLSSITNSVGTTSTLKLTATTDNPLRDILEIEALGSPGGQYIEAQVNGIAEHQINVGGEAWFGDQNRPLPAFLPIAFGYIESDGSISSGTGNFSNTWNAGLNRHEITISGYTYWYNNFTTIVTVGSSSGMARTSSVGGDLLIYTYDATGASAARPVQFVTYFNPVDNVPESAPTGGDDDALAP